jgi:hypothetical protein
MLVLVACGGSDSGGNKITLPESTAAAPTESAASATNDTAGETPADTESEAPTAATLTLPAVQDVLDAVAAGVSATSWEGTNTTKWSGKPWQIVEDGELKASDVCPSGKTDAETSVCYYGDQNATRTLVLVGDSHADMWLPAIDAIGKQAGWQVVQILKYQCSVAYVDVWNDDANGVHPQCAVFRQFAIDQITSIQPDVVIMTSLGRNPELVVDGKPTREGFADAWHDGLTQFVNEVKPLTERTLILGDIAYPTEPGADCLSANEGNVPACNTPREDAVFELNGVEQTVATETDVDYIDVIPWFCTETVCPAVVGGYATHWDQYHIPWDYALWLSAALGTEADLLTSAS